MLNEILSHFGLCTASAIFHNQLVFNPFYQELECSNNLNLISITYIMNFRIFGTSLISQ